MNIKVELRVTGTPCHALRNAQSSIQKTGTNNMNY